MDSSSDTAVRNAHVIGTLPPELKLMVLGHLTSLEDRKSLSLVNKQWADAVQSKMFYHLRSNFCVGPRYNDRAMQDLLDDTSNITRFTQVITILWGPYSAGANLGQIGQFLSSLKPNQLVGLQIADTTLRFPVISGLVKQNKLRQLQVRLSDWTRLMEGSTALPNLLGLNDLKVDVSNDFKFETLKLKENFHKLSLLHARGWGSEKIMFNHQEDANNDVNGHLSAENKSEPSVKIKMFDINHLVLLKVALKNADALSHHVDISKLRKLHLVNVKKVFDILDALAIDFDGSFAQLTEFHIVNLEPRTRMRFGRRIRLGVSRRSKSNTQISLENFLVSFRGLENLHINRKDLRLVDIASIIHHGSTLKELLFITSKTKDVVDLGLRDIARGCPHLVFLGINLFVLQKQDLNLGAANRHADIRTALLEIASLSNLRMLRLTNPPEYPGSLDGGDDGDDDDDIIILPGYMSRFSETHLQDLQLRAASLLIDLEQFGSNVHIIGFTPHDEQESGSEHQDVDSKPWWHYCFDVNKSYHKNVDNTIDKATPVLEWKATYPDITIMGNDYRA